MMQRPLEHVANERGATLVLIALSIVTLLGFLALAVDVGMLYSTRAEAQRAADAAALAGASALVDSKLIGSKTAGATTRGKTFGTANTMRRSPIADAEVTIELLGTDRVRATVRREAVPTFFASVMNPAWATVPVRAVSVARAITSGTADCLKPFGLPDGGYTPADYGKEVLIWAKQSEEFLLIGFNGSPPGLGNVAPAIVDQCPAGNSVTVGEEVTAAKPGNNAQGQVSNGMIDLLKLDPSLAYDETSGEFNRENWRESPRVGHVALYDPATYQAGGTDNITITNFATVFFTRKDPPGANAGQITRVWGRIFPNVGTPDACPSGAACSPNNFSLRLVQ